MSYDYLFKIIFIGDANVGKTALTERITKNDFHENRVLQYLPCENNDLEVLTSKSRVRNQ